MSSKNLKELGILVVVVLKARNLPDKHTFTKQDPFTVVQLGPFKEQTQIDKRGGQHPVWDEDLRIKVPAAEMKENRTLKVSCYAKEPKGDDLIGSGEVDITETLKTGEFDNWVKLGTDDTYRGEVYLEMTFFAAGPAPLARRPSKMTPNERLWRPPQTPPKTSSQIQGYPYGGSSPPARYQAELGNSAPPSPRPRPSHLAPPRESRSQSPSSRSEAPLPPLPSEIPAALRPAPHRASVPGPSAVGGWAGSAGTSPKSDNVPVPAALRPGAPGARPAAQRQQNQGSVPVAPSNVPPGQPAYTSPLEDIGAVPTTVTASPRNEYADLPPVSPSHGNQPVYGPSWPSSGNSEYPSHPPASAPGQPVYASPHPPASPFGHPQLPHPPQSAPTLPQAPHNPQTHAPHHHQGTYPSYHPSASPAAYPPINPTYDPPPLSGYTSSPPPATVPAIPVHSAGSLQLSFPEPTITPLHPSGSPGLGAVPGSYPTPYTASSHHHYPPVTEPTSAFYPNESEEERQRRLSTRYSSPMPLPPGVSPPPPPPKPAKSPSPNTSPSPRVAHTTPSPKITPASPIVPESPASPHPSRQEPEQQPRTNIYTQPPPSYSHLSHRSPSPKPVSESYLENQRLALERLKQEEADAELARRLAAEAEAEARAEAEVRRARIEGEARALALAEAEEEKERERERERQKEREEEQERELERELQRERERQKSLEEADEELARRLAREWNSDVLEEVRRETRDTSGSTGPGNGSRMPGGW